MTKHTKDLPGYWGLAERLTTPCEPGTVTPLPRRAHTARDLAWRSTRWWSCAAFIICTAVIIATTRVNGVALLQLIALGIHLWTYPNVRDRARGMV